MLGSLAFIGLKRRSTWLLIAVSTLAIGVAYLGMASTSQLAVACAFSVLGGFGNGIQWVSVMTALQEATPDDLQARITGLLESIASAMTGVGFLIGGIITAIASPPRRLRRLGHRRDRHRRRRHDRLADRPDASRRLSAAPGGHD